MASRPPEATPPTDQERGRWLVLNLMRMAGFALAIFGIVVTQGIVELAGADNKLVGYTLIAVGLADGFIVPQILARRWRSPKP